jgi:acyl-CoA reductase-like NAD-dependent aldehyde dehydrogenase
MSGRERARILHRAADLIRERADELVAVESHDVGKPVTLCRAVDVETAAQQYEYCAALAQGLDGATRATPLGALAYTLREPVGVVAAITPFNFPLVLSSTKIAAALAAGNVVVHKPADDTPLSALFMAQLLHDAGVPDGVLNVVTGSGQVVGEALLRHPGVDKIAFTGSTTVGRPTAIGRHAASVAGEHLKPVTMELGGNAAHLVFDDADLDVAIGAVIKAFVFNSGQFCMAGPRLLVARPLHDTVLGILADAVPQVPIGNPRNETTVIGPMAGERQLRNVEDYVELARKEGGRIVCGGERLELDGGFYYRPTVIADLPDDSRVVAEEVFGPVLTVQAFDTEDDAVALANGTPYGLAAGLQTRDVTRAHRVAARLQAGIVWVNDWAMLDPAIPFGGVKDSGFGREYGPEALEAYTKVKSVVVSLPPVGQPG